ncbi:hypothetical protein AB833_20995 [Chromatiales bacterium (ex Bugula neritina AB1)]|nr:hypothetical protein AB833_20995 [Chromatiales bacterium (ex Bugula neritina AB1)]
MITTIDLITIAIAMISLGLALLTYLRQFKVAPLLSLSEDTVQVKRDVGQPNTQKRGLILHIRNFYNDCIISDITVSENLLFKSLLLRHSAPVTIKCADFQSIMVGPCPSVSKTRLPKFYTIKFKLQNKPRTLYCIHLANHGIYTL